MQQASIVSDTLRVRPSRREHYQSSSFKRLIVASDGTWLNANSGKVRQSQNIPSNVTRISRAIKKQSSDGIPQITYYHYGVGSQGNVVDKVYGGITGEGLAENVREGYEFLASNWEPGDEIFLIGFSRGAFTARAIAGFIDQVGILTTDGLQYLGEIFSDVKHRHEPGYRPKDPDIPFRNKPSANDPAYRQELRRRRMTIYPVSIKAIGVWETVGALGTPRISWLEKFGLQSTASKQMSFYNTKLSNCIENAFQALALDERRSAFTPALWEKMPGNNTRLRQVWFPGVHANVGGGYADQELANITLCWLVSQLRDFLDIDLDYVLDQQDETEAYYVHSEQRIRPWSFGKIYDSLTGIYSLGGATTRTPGRYYVVDPSDGRKTDEPLHDTHEYVHSSVRARLKLDGPGYDDQGQYECRALKDWRLVIEPAVDGYGKLIHGRPDVYWRLRTGHDNVSTRILPESPLWPLERELLGLEPDRRLEDYVLEPPVQQRLPKRARSRRS